MATNKVLDRLNANKGKTALGGAVAAAMVLAVPLVAKWEGKRNDPYRDIIGVPTVCYGETRVAMRRYSDDECMLMLNNALADDFARPVLGCVPQLAERPYQLAAAASLAYNIGVAQFCRSTAARRFRSGDWAGGCEAMTWFNKAGGRVIQGLVSRRADEKRICMTDLS